MDSIESIRARLHEAEQRLARSRISAESGLNQYWLEKFSQGVIREPGYLRLSMLQTWLVSWAERSACPSASDLPGRTSDDDRAAA